ncbi:PAS domain-containing protein [Lutimaribacter marinistellae]|uniref:histidine kinase n=1 Tax=Lutimaribacter marinistellae TaxID=1820329 RepID=A0ABV7TDN1_9RHOB
MTPDQKTEKNLRAAVEKMPVAIVITDAQAEDNPITYVNDAFQRVTLYSREYAVGRNCRFLQGERSEPEQVENIRKGLRNEEEFQVTLTNYKADGTPFRNLLMISPIHDDQGHVSAFFGVQRELKDEEQEKVPQGEALPLLRELQHRVKNHLSMIVGMIRMQARQKVTPDSFHAIARRIESLALLYDELLDTSRGYGRDDEIWAGAYLSRIVSVISALEGRAAVRVNANWEEIRLPVDQAARLGLLLSELLTNALEHAFEGRESGSITVDFRQREDGSVRLVVSDDGTGLPEGSNWPFGAISVEDQQSRARATADQKGPLDTRGEEGRAGVGGSIVLSLTESMGAKLSVKNNDPGTRITVDLPRRQ